MSKEQEIYADLINHTPENEIHIKTTGREVVDLPPHLHTKEQIMYTTSGTLRIQVQDCSYFVPEHHIAWIPKGTEHKLSSNNRQISLRTIYCPLPDTIRRVFTVYNTNRLIEENLKFIWHNNVIRQSEKAEEYDFCISFLKLLLAKGEEYKTPLQAIVLPNDKRLQAVMSYMTDHLSEELSMDLIASRFGLSVRNLSRLFQNYGIRFTDYLNYQRITRAIEMIADRNKTMQEIAYDVGFNSPNNFNRVFKQILGTNPGTFYKNLQHH